MDLKNRLLVLLSLIIMLSGILTSIYGLHVNVNMLFLGIIIFAVGVYMLFWLMEKKDNKQRGNEERGRGYLTPW